MTGRNYIRYPFELQSFDLAKEIISDDKKEIKIYLEEREIQLPCPKEECQGGSKGVHTRWISYLKDIPIGRYKVKLALHRLEYECEWCGGLFVVEYPEVKRKRQTTERLKDYIYERSKEREFQEVARETGVSITTVRRYFKEKTKKQGEAEGEVKAERIHLDEVSSRKGHNYDTVVSSKGIKTRLLAMIKGRSQKDIEEKLKGIVKKLGVKEAVIDMWEAYKNTLLSIDKKIKIIADKFHVIKRVNETLDQVRKRRQREREKGEKDFLYRRRFKLLKGKENLSDEERKELEEVLAQEKEIREVYEFKERFRDWYKGGGENQEVTFKGFLKECEASSIKEMRELGKTLGRWEKEILNYFDTRATNGFAEGLNNKIKLLKRNGYGYPNREIFREKVIAAINN